MQYEYECDECGYYFIVKKPVAEFDTFEYCPKCSHSASKLISKVGHTYGKGMWEWGEKDGEGGLGDDYVHNW